MIELRLLGGLNLRRDDGRELDSALTQPKRVALLAYLALAAPHRFHRRDTLLGLFWPELDQDHARAALRQALHGLRQALGPVTLTGRGDEEVGLDQAGVWCDARAFDERLSAGDTERALELYRGDFLEGFFLSGADEFERWVEEQRTRLRQAAARAAGAVIERCEAAGDIATAAEWARRAAGLMPLDEGVVQRLIALLDRLGDRVGAVGVYERFAARIANEFEVKPAPETMALISTVRTRDAARVLPERLPTVAGGAEIPAARGVPTAPKSPSGRRAARRVVWSSAAIAVAVALAAGALYVRSNPVPELRADRVVVATFANQTGDTALDRLGELAADWISRGLSETGLVEVADPGAKPPKGAVVAPNAAEAVRGLAVATGSEVAVWGTFFRSGDSLEFAANITDERRRELVRSLGPVLGAPNDPRPAIAALRQRIIASLAVVLDPRLKDWQGRTSQPPSYAAYRVFAAGVDAMNRLNTSEAVRLLYRAAALDSTYTLPLVWAAFAHWWRFECEKTEGLSKKLATVPERLARVDRLMLDRWVAQCHGDLPAVYQRSRLLVEALPGSELMAGYLGRDALLIDRPREAISILRRLHPDRGALRDWPYYFYWLTAAYHSLGEHERELEAARLQRRLNPSNLGSLRHEALALAALGRVREVNELLDELPAQRPHPWRTPAAVIRETALELRAHGYRAASDSVLDRALAWLDGRPVKERGSEGARRLRLQTLYAAGRWEPAQVLAEELVREHPDSLTYQGVRGALAAQRGDRAEAAQADSVLAARSRPFLQGFPAYWRACIAAQLGDRPGAVRLIAQAHREGLWLTGEFWEQPIATLHADPCFEPLHDYPPFEQLLRPKG